MNKREINRVIKLVDRLQTQAQKITGKNDPKLAGRMIDTAERLRNVLDQSINTATV